MFKELKEREAAATPVLPGVATGTLKFSKVLNENQSQDLARVSGTAIRLTAVQPFVLELQGIQIGFPLYLVANTRSDSLVSCKTMEDYYNGVLKQKVNSEPTAGDWGEKVGAWARTFGIEVGDTAKDAWEITKQFGEGVAIGVSGNAPAPVTPPGTIPVIVTDTATPSSPLFENVSSVQYRKPYVVSPDALKLNKNRWLVRQLDGKTVSNENFKGQTVYFIACQMLFSNEEKKFKAIPTLNAQLSLDLGAASCSTFLDCLEKVDQKMVRIFN